jgi:hypothetical protein
MAMLNSAEFEVLKFQGPDAADHVVTPEPAPINIPIANSLGLAVTAVVPPLAFVAPEAKPVTRFAASGTSNPLMGMPL